ncbi:hypothetical protein F4803DRAFT_21438 [Xylaria telfairii]|nr:hypothetical protein F4803DRAFT_21438 [Xylaria telfairii]
MSTPQYHGPWYYSLKGSDDEESVAALPPPPASSTKPASIFKPCANIRALPENLFRKSLERFLPRQNDPHASKKIIREAVFSEISQLLNDYGKPEWGLLPRTFAVLWILGIPEKLNDFIAEGRNDYAIPYSHGNLPDTIKGSALRDKFLQLQAAVRGRQEGVVELEEGGRHLYLDGNADIYFYSMRTLGSGRFGKVDAVRSWQTTKTYARKRILRGDSVFQDQGQLLAFEKEIKSLKNLTHHHVVKLVGSYTDATSLGLIMSPVADMDLHAYLELKTIEPEHRKRMLRSYFGCLASALSYIHGENIRHKDIKPNNILVKDDRVLLSDFGTSRTCFDGHFTSNGVSREGTPRYWAPEVGDGADRNTASDVWSLGCVFLEMATTLFGYSHYDMLGFYSKNGTENYARISLNEGATRLWIQHLRNTTPGVDADVLEWTSSMLLADQIERPTAAQIRGRILDCEAHHNYICLHCSTGSSQRYRSDTQKLLLVEPQHGRLDTQRFSQIENEELGPDAEKLFHSEDKDDVSPEMKEAPGMPKQSDLPRQSNPPDELSDDLSKLSGQGTQMEAQPQEIFVEQKARPARNHVRFNYNNLERVIRFEALPVDCRPEPTRGKPQEQENEEENPEFIIPDPIRPPPLHQRDTMPLPKASLVPSYILAGTNHFSRNEIYAKRVNRTTNVFVYGRLMFPSVLQWLANRSLKGGYAPQLQRRIFPSAESWNQANASIQHTSEIMTPGRLRGYDRWKPSGLDCAVIQRSSVTPEILKRRERGKHREIKPSGYVLGFLIVGVETEAVRWLDLLFASSEQNLRRLEPVKEEKGTEGKADMHDSPLRGEALPVEVELSSGEMAEVDAYTYVWKHGATDLWEPWTEDSFIRGRNFQSIFRDNVEAEKSLASKMKIYFPLIGDVLCAAVVTGDAQKLEHLLYDGWDPDSPCRFYGTALQAAIAVGNDLMVRTLLKYGANVNRKGGRYGNALIAAAFASRKTITRTLLSSGSDVFATHKVHVNALYQAVGHADYAIAEMLLEHGAWLIEDWGEVVDLATELGDTEVIDLLAQYDVRQIHQQKMLARYGVTDWGDVTERRHLSSRNVMMAIVRKGAAVHTTAGNWKGRKGVAVVVAALGEGVSLGILPQLRNAINLVHNIAQFIKIVDGIYGDTDAAEQPASERRYHQTLGTPQDRNARVAQVSVQRFGRGGGENVHRPRRPRSRERQGERELSSLHRGRQQRCRDDRPCGHPTPETYHSVVRPSRRPKLLQFSRE